MQIGAQLWTVHNHTKTLEGFSETLKKVAAIGYKSVQVSGTCPYDPAWLRDELAKNDLVCAITHISADRFFEEGCAKVVADHAIFGCKNIGLGSMPPYAEDMWERYKIFREKMIPVAKEIRDLGAKLHFHNHYQEFQGVFAEKSAIDWMLEDFPEDALDFTLDIGWAHWGGADVLKLIEKLNGRLSRIHLKDYLDEIPEGFEENRVYLRPIYEGKLDYDAYINALAKTDCEYMLVEQDRCYDEDDFECLRRSYENVTKRFPNTK